MAIPDEDFTETVGLPGLLFPFVPHSIETGLMQDGRESGGGFPVYGKKGEGDKAYASFPQVADSTKDDGSTKDDPDGFFKGIAVRTKFDCHDEGYAKGDHVNVLKKGRVWVRVLGEVLSGQPAYVNTTNNGITATASGNTAIPGGTFKTSAADGKLAQLEIA